MSYQPLIREIGFEGKKAQKGIKDLTGETMLLEKKVKSPDGS